ncbi:MAG: protein-S-isoprenylcysteine O-methyltransferase Ste14 [Arenicella sp.]|jgi:protein-S-isoprenylcysteine O-methyltransferase Ste14
MIKPGSSQSDFTEPSSSNAKQFSANPPKQDSVCHGIFWWSLKFSCGTILVAGLFIGVLYQLDPWFVVSRGIGQALVIIGSASAIFHYLRLKSLNKRFEQPDILETEYGLFRYVRHPMYLSDCLLYIGLFLLFPTIPTVIVLGLGIVALVRQSKVEDKYLAERFAEPFSQWHEHSKLIIPFVY